jgi:hypothetical protein
MKKQTGVSEQLNDRRDRSMLRFSFPRQTVELLTRGLGLARCASVSERGAGRGGRVWLHNVVQDGAALGAMCCSCEVGA